MDFPANLGKNVILGIRHSWKRSAGKGQRAGTNAACETDQNRKWHDTSNTHG